MLNYGTATPNPKVYEVVISIDMLLTGPTGGGVLDLLYFIGGNGQSLVSAGGPMGGQTVTFPSTIPGSTAENTSSVFQGTYVYYLYVPSGLPSATMGTNNGARFQLAYISNQTITACTGSIDVLVKEAMFRPWDWTTFGDSLALQRTAMPYRWWQIHRPPSSELVPYQEAVTYQDFDEVKESTQLTLAGLDADSDSPIQIVLPRAIPSTKKKLAPSLP